MADEFLPPAVRNVLVLRELIGLTLPDHMDIEPGLAKLGLLGPVPALVPGDLLDPEIGVAFRDCGLRAALMPVPEAAVNKYDPPFRPVSDVGRPRQVTVLNAEAKPVSGEPLPYQKLRLGVGLPDALHPGGGFGIGLQRCAKHLQAARFTRPPGLPRLHGQAVLPTSAFVQGASPRLR